MNACCFERFAVGLIFAFTALAGGVVGQNTPPPPKPAGAADANVESAVEADPGLLPMTPEQLQQRSLDYYEKIREKSPFSFKIVKQEGPPPESFAKDLALAGFTIDSGKGITFASVVDKKQNTRFVINTKAPNKDGIQLVKLNRGPTLLETTVLARKGVEEATIAADKQIIERKAVGVAPGAAAARPANAPGQPANAPGRNAIQGQINQQLRPQGPNGQQPPGNVPGVNNANAAGNAANGAAPPNVNVQAAAPNGAPMSAGDQAAAAAGIMPQNTGAPPGAQPNNRPNNQGGAQRPARRRVILPPPVGN